MKKLQSTMKLESRLGPSWGLVVFILMAVPIVTAQRNPSGNSPQAQIQSTKSSADANQIIVDTDRVTLNVTVIDSEGFAITGLEKKNFAITDNKHPQEITFFSDADLPLSVGIVFDLSGSMSGKKIARAREAPATFMQTSHPDDEFFLIGFNSQPQLLLDRTRDSDAVIKKLLLVEPDGATALYDAAYLALERVAHGSYTKRAILIISDGEDNNSRYSLSELRRSLKESGVSIYAVLTDNGTIGRFGGYTNLVLSDLASVSGGRAFSVGHSKQMNETFDQIALELRHQYSIGYRPSSFTPDGKWHRLTVKVTTPNKLKRVYVRHGEGYYASAPTR